MNKWRVVNNKTGETIKQFDNESSARKWFYENDGFMGSYKYILLSPIRTEETTESTTQMSYKAMKEYPKVLDAFRKAGYFDK